MKRRDFLKASSVAAGACALSQTSIFSMAYTNTLPPEEIVAGMPRRSLGRTGERLSVIGFPGLALVHDEYGQARCDEAVHGAFERGVNFFDVAPAYGNGKCETRLGIALRGLDRQEIFLACKTRRRDRDGARQELETSLDLLKTDYFDLYQMHHIRSVDEVRQALAPGGALETFLEAKEEGRVKYLGFSAHTTRGALEIMNGFGFDTVMFPINFVELYNRGFGKEVLDLANEQGAAVLSIKPMSYGGWPEGAQRTRDWWYQSVEERMDVDLAWRFALSRKGVISGIPPSFLDLVDKAIAAARDYRPPTQSELEKLEEMAAGRLSIFEREERQFARGERFDADADSKAPLFGDYYHYA
jgi:predicted aldo/keto reductase-like oxidoreductase